MAGGLLTPCRVEALVRTLTRHSIGVHKHASDRFWDSDPLNMAFPDVCHVWKRKQSNIDTSRPTPDQDQKELSRETARVKGGKASEWYGSISPERGAPRPSPRAQAPSISRGDDSERAAEYEDQYSQLGIH